MAGNDAVRMGMVGLGGYGFVACHSLLACHDEGQAGDPPIVFTMVFERFPDQFPELMAELTKRKIPVVTTYRELLGSDVEGVWLPLPIDLHEPFTTQALAAGKGVICEKPAAGSIDEVNAMIAARERTGRPVAIGYQSIYDPATLTLKRRLLDGCIGQVRRATVHACWPRGHKYYERADWAGRIRRGDRWVLDSPANNALAHQVNTLMFLLGKTPFASAVPVTVEAELYRANRIENYDTCAFRVTVEGGAQALVLLTHGCANQDGPWITVQGAAGQVDMPRESITIPSPNGPIELKRNEHPSQIARRFAKALRGRDDDAQALCALENARMQTIIINAASQAAVIHDVADEYIDEVDGPSGVVRAVRGINELFPRCAAEGKLIHESGLAPWAQPAARLDVRDYNHFAGPATHRRQTAG